MEKQNISCKESVLATVKNNLLVILTIVGVMFGLALGFGIREANLSDDAIMWIGKLFLL